MSQQQRPKSIPQHVKEVKGRTVTGIFSVFGNLDSYNDRIWPGAFSKTIAERSGKVVFLWQHDFNAPPVAVIKGIREVPREQLPTDILETAPEALGGMEVTREYLDTPRGEEILANLKAGQPLQMSFGYDAVKYDFEEDPNAQFEWMKIRNLREVRLWEVSDVLWGANDATLASKALLLPLETVLEQLKRYTGSKAGARHSTKDTELLNAIHAAALDLGCTTCKGILEAEEDTDKARPEPSLTLSRLHDRLRILQLQSGS